MVRCGWGCNRSVTIATSLAERVRDTIRRHGMFRDGEAVLVAVSGGPDSVTLLDVLCSLRGELALALTVAHVHHGLRPEADADAAAVRRLCERLEVACHVERVTVKRSAPWDGLEAEARRARHAALRLLARALGVARVATGHTADDQAETVLMRLLQGAGPRGLGAIAPVRGLLVSPLIETRRVEIVEYLRARGLAWVEDASNRDPRFLRSRVRHELLPFMVEIAGPSVVEALSRSAAAARALVADLDARACTELARLGTPGPEGLTLEVATLAEQPLDLAVEILRQAAAQLGEHRPFRSPVHRALRGLLAKAPRRRTVRLGGLVVERSGRHLRVGPAVLPALAPRSWARADVLDLAEVGQRLRARVVAPGPGYVVPREPTRAAFDADLLPAALTVRARRRGDVFSPFGGPALRRLKSFLIDAGIPRWQRPRTPLIEAGGEIIWVAGVRRGRIAPVTATTVRILEITLEVRWPSPEPGSNMADGGSR
jgi:tRNA(Ile)-lysidine synthase